MKNSNNSTAQTATDESGEQLPLSPITKFPVNIKKDLLAWTGNAITKYDFYNMLCLILKVQENTSYSFNGVSVIHQ
jgi:hypothetical protein